ncbi:MAG TPA: hypothetical protein H9778_05735 [Candidatus Parabacteroides intestinavium]|jgi:hypothetical protein|nr:hypothetical protein [Candidatus Parabacteroides intestinavium]
MDQLKDFIDKNREAFDTDDLPIGDLDRFLTKLEQTENRRSKRRWLEWAAIPIAAAIALFLYLALPWGEDAFDEPQYICELHSEMTELRTYYMMQMEGILMEMEEKSLQSNNPASRKLLEAGQHIQNSCRQFDREVLPTLPCSDEGVFAINQQYRNSLSSLQQLYGQMNK